MAVRGSPAKGVGWGDWREGSNPSFSAKAERPCVARAFRFVLDKRDSKGGAAKAAVRRLPAPGSDGPEQRSLEDKLPGAFAENPSFSAKAERPCVARAFRFVLDKRDSKGGAAKAAVRRLPAPGSDGPEQRSLEDKLPGAFAENPSFSAKAERPCVARAFRFVLDKRDSQGGSGGGHSHAYVAMRPGGSLSCGAADSLVFFPVCVFPHSHRQPGAVRFISAVTLCFFLLYYQFYFSFPSWVSASCELWFTYHGSQGKSSQTGSAAKSLTGQDRSCRASQSHGACHAQS